jgi:hypothetical protein
LIGFKGESKEQVNQWIETVKHLVSLSAGKPCPFDISGKFWKDAVGVSVSRRLYATDVSSASSSPSSVTRVPSLTPTSSSSSLSANGSNASSNTTATTSPSSGPAAVAPVPQFFLRQMQKKRSQAAAYSTLPRNFPVTGQTSPANASSISPATTSTGTGSNGNGQYATLTPADIHRLASLTSSTSGSQPSTPLAYDSANESPPSSAPSTPSASSSRSNTPPSHTPTVLLTSFPPSSGSASSSTRPTLSIDATRRSSMIITSTKSTSAPVTPVPTTPPPIVTSSSSSTPSTNTSANDTNRSVSFFDGSNEATLIQLSTDIAGKPSLTHSSSMPHFLTRTTTPGTTGPHPRGRAAEAAAVKMLFNVVKRAPAALKTKQVRYEGYLQKKSPRGYQLALK